MFAGKGMLDRRSTVGLEEREAVGGRADYECGRRRLAMSKSLDHARRTGDENGVVRKFMTFQTPSHECKENLREQN